MVTATSIPDAAIIDQAVELLRLNVLSASNQLMIEHAIGLVSINHNCTRARAAQILNHQAFPN